MGKSGRRGGSKVMNPMLGAELPSIDESDEEDPAPIVVGAPSSSGSPRAAGMPPAEQPASVPGALSDFGIVGGASDWDDEHWRAPFGRLVFTNGWWVGTLGLTLAALVITDLANWCFSSESDSLVDAVQFLLMLAILADTVVYSLASKSYFLGVFFWLDLVAGLSLVVEISWLWERGSGHEDYHYATWSRAARAAEVGAQAARVLRATRLAVANPLSELEIQSEAGIPKERIPELLTESIVWSSLRMLVGAVALALAASSSVGFGEAQADARGVRFRDIATARCTDGPACQVNGSCPLFDALFEPPDDTLFYLELGGVVVRDRTHDPAVQQLRNREKLGFCTGGCGEPVSFCDGARAGAPAAWVADYDVHEFAQQQSGHNLLVSITLMATLLFMSWYLSVATLRRVSRPVNRLIREEKATKALLDLLRAIQGADEQEDLMPIVRQGAMRIIEARVVNLFFTLPTGEYFCPCDEDDSSPFNEEILIGKGEGMVGRAAERKESDIIDRGEMAALLAEGKCPSLTDMGTAGWQWEDEPPFNAIVMPFIKGGVVVGVIQCINKENITDDDDEFDEFDKQLLRRFCDRATGMVVGMKQTVLQRRALTLGDDTLHDMLDACTTFSTNTDQDRDDDEDQRVGRAHERLSAEELKAKTKRNMAKLRVGARIAGDVVDNKVVERKYFTDPKYGFDRLPLPDLKEVQRWGFANLDMDVETMAAQAMLMYDDAGILGDGAGGVLRDLPLDADELYSFVKKLFGTYNEVPYHNLWHAFSVFQGCYWMMTKTDAGKYFTKMEKFSMLTAALGHDAAHDGINSSFHIACQSEYAHLYNDHAPLENTHARTMFDVMRDEDCNIFKNFHREPRTRVRKMIVDAILATDMSFHADHVKQAEAWAEPGHELTQDADRKELMELLMHGCDIASAAYPWKEAQRWSRLVTIEFQAQVEREDAKFLPVSSFMDTRKGQDKMSAKDIERSFATNQANFIGFVLKPYFECLMLVVPEWETVLDEASTNEANWRKVAAGKMKLDAIGERDVERIGWSKNVGMEALKSQPQLLRHCTLFD